jgi:hypothetical protein
MPTSDDKLDVRSVGWEFAITSGMSPAVHAAMDSKELGDELVNTECALRRAQNWDDWAYVAQK